MGIYCFKKKKILISIYHYPIGFDINKNITNENIITPSALTLTRILQMKISWRKCCKSVLGYTYK